MSAREINLGTLLHLAVHILKMVLKWMIYSRENTQPTHSMTSLNRYKVTNFEFSDAGEAFDDNTIKLENKNK